MYRQLAAAADTDADLVVEFSYPRSALLFALIILLIPTGAFPAGVGDSAPNKCSAKDVEYTVSNIVPNGVCAVISDTLTVDFDVNIVGSPQRYNFAVGYTNAGDSILQDVSCLNTGIDLDSAGCLDYDGSGTATAPLVASSSFDVSCDLDGNLLVDPLVGVDFYVSFDASSGGTAAEITSPKCSLQEGTTFPLQPASLSLVKTVINDSGGVATATDWTLTAVMGAGASTLSGPSGVSSTSMPAGDYILSESGPAGYVLDSIACSGATFDATTSTLTLEPNQSATCEYVNNDDVVVPPAQTLLTLIKNVINDNGGSAVAADFAISIDGTEVISGVSNVVSAAVDLVISELDLPAYKNGVWSCVDNAGLTPSLPSNGLATGTTLNLAVGADVVCAIENNDASVDLSITKSATTNSPSIGDTIRFNLLVNNAGPDDATDVFVTDIVPAGFSYVSGSILGGDAAIDADPAGAGLRWNINELLSGASATLSFQATVLAP